VIEMFGPPIFAFSFWWLFPLFMMGLCFLFMRGRICSMGCGIGPRFHRRSHTGRDSAPDATEEYYSELASKLEKRIEALETIIMDYEKKDRHPE
jgi:hypothetical protein